MKKVLTFLLPLLLLACTSQPEENPEDSLMTQPEQNQREGEQSIMTGILLKKSAGPAGTFKQYFYFVLEEENQEHEEFPSLNRNPENVLFNYNLISMGFDNLAGQRVSLRVESTTGYLGPRKEPIQGWLVLELISAEPVPIDVPN